MRKRIMLSREVVDDVLRARGCVTMTIGTTFAGVFNEVVFIEKPCVDNQIHGLLRVWQLDSPHHLRSEVTYVNGKRHGYLRRFHSNGVKRSEQRFVNDILSGDLQQWNADGTPAKSIPKYMLK